MIHVAKRHKLMRDCCFELPQRQLAHLKAQYAYVSRPSNRCRRQTEQGADGALIKPFKMRSVKMKIHGN
jgi:hypothetical protein